MMVTSLQLGAEKFSRMRWVMVGSLLNLATRDIESIQAGREAATHEAKISYPPKRGADRPASFADRASFASVVMG
jgi:hypothetical protein